MTTPASLLHPDSFLSPLAIDEAVRRALNEDLGRAGDITSIATIPETTPAHAILIARQPGVIAGLPLAVATFQTLSPDINIHAHIRDGATVAAGVHVQTISGPARAMLAGERTAVLQRARTHAGHLVKIEIEVDTLAQLREVLDTGLADVVLLDNMDIATVTEAVRLANGRVVLEASGGVTQSSIANIAATGVDYASSGALTHSAPNFDVALDIDA